MAVRIGVDGAGCIKMQFGMGDHCVAIGKCGFHEAGVSATNAGHKICMKRVLYSTGFKTGELGPISGSHPDLKWISPVAPQQFCLCFLFEKKRH